MVLHLVFPLAITLFLTGCMSTITPPPVVSPFHGDGNWVLMENLTNRVAGEMEPIVVPRGFVTDFASVPRPFWSLLSPTDEYAGAAVFHDFNYWEQRLSKEQCDALFRRDMEEAGVPALSRSLIYCSVRTFGSGAWKRNARMRADGVPRVVPEEYLPIPSKVTWAEYRRRIYGK